MTAAFHPHAEGFELPGDGDGVLLIHGFTGSPAHLRLLGRQLNHHGYHVLGVRLAGHGTSLEEMERTRAADWLASALTAYRRLAARGKPVHAAGLSMGGLISLLLAGDEPVASVTTINSPMIVRDRRHHLARVIARFQRFSYWEEDEDDLPTGEAADYFVHYPGVPVRTIPELSRLIRRTRRRLGRVDCPVLVIQSRIDETVVPRSATIIRDGVGPDRARIVWLDRSRHVATLDEERDVIAASILSHLAAARVG